MHSLFLRLLYFTFLFFPGLSWAVILTGRVSGPDQKPLPFANVYIKGTTHGTNTNDDGIYVLDVTAGSHEVVFKYLGYKTVSRHVLAGTEKIILDIQLEKENYQLAEVIIRANTEDPAYEIIRQAQKKRKFYLGQVNSFACDVYIKGVQKLLRYPKKFLGQDINLDNLIDTATGILYLSESVSRFYFLEPDRTKEVMLSSKVSGDNQAFSFNQNAMMQYNFYHNLIGKGGLSERGFVSPIASSALLYYTYKLIGTFTENSQPVHKIEVIPVRPSDPVFRGFIYITDSTWRIHSLDLYVTRESQVQFVDTLRLEQVYLPVEHHEEVWMPVSGKFSFSFNLFGFRGNGSFHGINSNFVINPELEKNFFDGEVMKINKDANKKDLDYWMKMRPVPLSKEESTDYVKKDSMEVLRESPAYMDSVDRQSNKIKPLDLLLTGYTYERRYTKTEFNFDPLIRLIEYNTVEGFRAGLSVSFTKRYENRKSWTVASRGAYGFANKTFQGSGQVQYNYNPFHLGVISLEGGQDAVQYNNKKPVAPLINSSYTLLAERNYMKLYQKRFLSLENRYELWNGMLLTLGGEYSDRLPMVNHSDYTLVDLKNKRFFSNDPKFPADTLNLPPFVRNQSFLIDVHVRIRIRQRYVSRPYSKIVIGSKYPTIDLNWRRSIPGIFGSSGNFNFLRAGLGDEMQLGMLGTTRYSISYGNYVTSDSITFVNFRHFQGNLTLFSSFRLEQFNLLEYYLYSTPKDYAEVHVEHDFSGFLLNKIPWIRKLKLGEVAGIHYLAVRDKPVHYEYSFGIQKLNLVRLDFVSALAPNLKPRFGVRLGILLRLGGGTS